MGIKGQQIFGPVKSRLEFKPKEFHFDLTSVCTPKPLNFQLQENTTNLTNVVQPDPVGSIHFLLDVPGYDEILAAVQRVLQGGRRQRGPALGGHQVRVTVGTRKPDGTADDRDGIDGSCTASLRQSSQVLRAEGVPEVGAAPAWS